MTVFMSPAGVLFLLLALGFIAVVALIVRKVMQKQRPRTFWVALLLGVLALLISLLRILPIDVVSKVSSGGSDEDNEKSPPTR